MIRLDAAPEAQEGDEAPDVVALFAIGDTEYTIPATPRVGIGLRYLRNLRKMPPALAESALLEDLLGEDGYEALCSYEGLKPEQMTAISEAAHRHALGVLEDEGGDEGNG